jgi:VIT1/CCC1 family predicted Fe2+/Mn2+ transporter
MPFESTNYLTLSAMITPAIFLTANGSLIISTSNRASRVIDRIRILSEQSDRLDRGNTDFDFPAERLLHLQEQIDALVWRGDRIRMALTFLYMAFAAFVGSSLTLAIDVLLGSQFIALPTSFAVLGVALLFCACVNLLREARESLRWNGREVQFYRDLHYWRRNGADTTATASRV